MNSGGKVMSDLSFNILPAPVQNTLEHLLDLPKETLVDALRASRSAEGYQRFEFPKGNGKTRVIHAPTDALKAAQRSVLDRLLSQIAVTPFAHGFVPHRSIITNALVHAPSARSVLSLDLQDAFPSVSEKRVHRMFQWRLGSLLSLTAPQLDQVQRAQICDVVTQLCTRDGSLPQGAPTSGYILNLVCARLDRLIYGVAQRSGLPRVKYTRYADDLTITSSSREPIPPELIEELRRVVVTAGFRVNPHKVHTHTDVQKAIVICGVRLHNGALALPKSSLRRYRAQITSAARQSPQELSEETRHQLKGVLSFLRSIYPAPPRPLIKPLNELLTTHQELVQDEKAWLNSPQTKQLKRFAHFTY